MIKISHNNLKQTKKFKRIKKMPLGKTCLTPMTKNAKVRKEAV